MYLSGGIEMKKRETNWGPERRDQIERMSDHTFFFESNEGLSEETIHKVQAVRVEEKDK